MYLLGTQIEHRCLALRAGDSSTRMVATWLGLCLRKLRNRDDPCFPATMQKTCVLTHLAKRPRCHSLSMVNLHGSHVQGVANVISLQTRCRSVGSRVFFCHYGVQINTTDWFSRFLNAYNIYSLDFGRLLQWISLPHPVKRYEPLFFTLSVFLKKSCYLYLSSSTLPNAFSEFLVLALFRRLYSSLLSLYFP